MNLQDYYVILEALHSCKTTNNYTSHRYYIEKDQKYDEKLVESAINTLIRLKPKN